MLAFLVLVLDVLDFVGDMNYLGPLKTNGTNFSIRPPQSCALREDSSDKPQPLYTPEEDEYEGEGEHEHEHGGECECECECEDEDQDQSSESIISGPLDLIFAEDLNGCIERNYGETRWPASKHFTISRDQTTSSNFQKEQLAVLKESPTVQSTEQEEQPFSTSNHALQDYNMQLMLLEQQNKKRLLMARQEQEYLKLQNTDSHGSGPPSAPPFPMTKGLLSSSSTMNLSGHSKNARSGPAVQNQGREDGTDNAQLLQRIRVLENENRGLKGLVANHPSQPTWKPPQWQILYRFEPGHQVFLGPPSWTIGNDRNFSLRGELPLVAPDLYLQRHNNMAFVVYKIYSQHRRTTAALKTDIMPPPEHNEESLKLISDEMIKAVESFFSKQPDFGKVFPNFDVRAEIPAPYLFWYYYRPSSPQVLRELMPRHRALMQLLTGWIEINYKQEYTQAAAQLSKGFVSFELMKYLVRPGDILVSKTKGHLQAHLATSWARDDKSESSPSDRQSGGDLRESSNKRTPWRWKVSSWSYGYDGSFFKKDSTLTIELLTGNPDDEVNMQDLNVLPLRFTGGGMRQALEQRGKVFWSCRVKRLVSYQVNTSDSLDSDGERFMIDFSTYKKLHSDSPAFKRPRLDREEMAPEVIKQDEPPSAPDLFLFPPTIIGYNLRRKKWVDLEVDHIKDVTWNKSAFKNLVVDEETKELVQALVTNQLAAEKGTDLIGGKGNGLIILLHGGPGTGKTFTAESVAEMAEKPLFRVTCGDVGTQPEEVEKYLESVLHLGKIWGCVVLLDEADVFLEERSLADLQRNALVSVFLRVLEYYDGILILTSNRVGTFDEAFKSRIQLALHYENLTTAQRSKIWKNFINRLKSLDEENIDFDDIDCYISELAGHEMNGRQIRNAITTARQLAQYQGKIMTYTHLKHVIKVAGKFDKYLSAVKEGFTDDVIAREGGLR
ncbi:hypothetical protein GP486_001346 [Trichoglossum hirsutum]|uniref:AAA+ ATPase domain-containing protein n=1 Tax=Trichoglossum hirsutum TaxID=265104 RepID=A0A9P8LH30_9PEZI|nr:hypothetical protein GP486_001346 [Trichoglossum hirsutum]